MSYYDIECKYEFESPNWVNRTSRLMINNTCWGSFSIMGSPFDKEQKIGEQKMTLRLHHSYRGIGFEKMLMRHLILRILKYEPCIQKNQFIYLESVIDCDVDDGFWNFLIKPNDDENYGVISFKELQEFSLSPDITDEYSDCDDNDSLEDDVDYNEDEYY